MLQGCCPLRIFGTPTPSCLCPLLFRWVGQAGVPMDPTSLWPGPGMQPDPGHESWQVPLNHTRPMARKGLLTQS